MPLSTEELRRAADRARIALDARELVHFALDLDAILARIDALPAAGAPGGTPTPLEPVPVARLRADDVAPAPLAVPPAALAPEWRDGLFTVPRLPFAGGAGEEAAE